MPESTTTILIDADSDFYQDSQLVSPSHFLSGFVSGKKVLGLIEIYDPKFRFVFRLFSLSNMKNDTLFYFNQAEKRQKLHFSLFLFMKKADQKRILFLVIE